MNDCRIHILDISSGDKELFQQTEVARSKPNELLPIVHFDIPVEYEVSAVRVQVGYGNTDVYILATKFDPETQARVSVPGAEDVH